MKSVFALHADIKAALSTFHDGVSHTLRKTSTSLLSAGTALLLTATASAVLPTGNLIVNGSGGAALTTGWSNIVNGGSGWGRSTTGGADETPGYFITSYANCTRSQTIDLLATGATAAELDAAPPIRVSELIGCDGNNGKLDKFYIKVELRRADNSVVKSWNVGTLAAMQALTRTGFEKFEYEFSGYGPGVRYVYFEDGGIDVGYWGGSYGTYHDAANVTIFIDTDGDTIPDFWEIANGTNPNVADDYQDPDNDGLTNYDEYLFGTEPLNPDTDEDGLLDGVEDGYGTYLDEFATGTDRLNPDSDGDGLLDGVEVPTEDYTNAAHPGTDPNKGDTDGDSFPDYAEIIAGSNPKDNTSFPTYTYGDIMKENFDGGALASTYTFVKSLGAYQPAVFTATAPNLKVARLTNSTTDTNNALAFDAIASNAKSVKLTFDFRMSADPGGEAADGFGVGFFKTSAYAATGGLNPGYTAANDAKWEEPAGNLGIGGAALIGFDIYGGATEGNTVRVSGPAIKNKTLGSGVATSQLNANVFHRATITAISNGPGSTAITVDVTYDVNGTAPTTQRLVSGVVVKDFDITSDGYRIIFGSRTGGATVTTDIDNIVLASTAVSLPAETPVITASSMDRSATPVKFVMTWSSRTGSTYTLESSTDLANWTAVSSSVTSGGTSTTYNIPLPAGSPAKCFYRVTPNP